MSNSSHLQRPRKVGQRFLSGFSIEASVGDWSRHARNRPADVEIIQLLLEHAAKTSGCASYDPKGVDGKISRTPGRSNTEKAIRAFQSSFMRVPDGLVEPGGRTIGNLRAGVVGTAPKGLASTRSVMTAAQPGDGLPH